MIFRNSEHYSDPTAGKAIANVMREEEGEISEDFPDFFPDDNFAKELERGNMILRVQDAKKHHDPDRENWEDLIIQIAVQAAEDYRDASRERRKDHQRKAEKMMREVETFFLSDWFKQLTNVDGKNILKRLQEEAG